MMAVDVQVKDEQSLPDGETVAEPSTLTCTELKTAVYFNSQTCSTKQQWRSTK